jgi:hypothetical protein
VLDAVPAGLRARPNWVVWKLERRGGKWTKPPRRCVDGGRTYASCDDPASWSSFEQAIAVNPATVSGIGYVFSPDDPFTGVDLDACIDGESGELHPAATEVLGELLGYQERSPSGLGMHAIVEAELRGDRHRTSKTPWGGALEIYSERRFFTVTGEGAGEIINRQAQLDALVGRMFGEEDSSSDAGADDGPARSLEELLKLGKLSRIVKHEGKAPKDSSDSGWDFYLSCEAVRLGCTDAEITILVKAARRDDPKGARAKYIADTIKAARKAVGEVEADPWLKVSRRWGAGNNPIISGEAVGGEVLHLTRRDGSIARIAYRDSLFHAATQFRLVTRALKTYFVPLTCAEALEIAQTVSNLVSEPPPDPTEEARNWAETLASTAGARIEFEEGKVAQHVVLAQLLESEEALRRSGRDLASRTAVLCEPDGRFWLPADALMAYARGQSGGRLSWPDFAASLAEAGWEKRKLETKAPRIKRIFFAGELVAEA